jgi:hypothetical protein
MTVLCAVCFIAGLAVATISTSQVLPQTIHNAGSATIAIYNGSKLASGTSCGYATSSGSSIIFKNCTGSWLNPGQRVTLTFVISNSS